MRYVDVGCMVWCVILLIKLRMTYSTVGVVATASSSRPKIQLQIEDPVVHWMREQTNYKF